jgi:hypothetical protein
MLFPVVFPGAPIQEPQGLTVIYKRASSEVKYQFRGQMLTTYAGAIDAPPSRKIDISGTLVLRTESRPGERWVVVAVTDGLKATRSGKAVTKDESHLAFKGLWTQTIGGRATYTTDGKAMLPFAFNAPLWPISWAPIHPDKGMKIDEAWSSIFMFPAQAFLEDDPIGWFAVPLDYVFHGSDPFDKKLYSFSLKTDYTFDEAVKHPEASDLKLSGNAMLDGRIKTRKEDGRLESASVIMSFEIMLTNDAYPFGFSKARASITASLDRIQ